MFAKDGRLSDIFYLRSWCVPPSGRHPLFQATIPFSLSLRVDSQPLGFVTFFPTMLSLSIFLLFWRNEWLEEHYAVVPCCGDDFFCTIGMEMIISSQSPFADTN